MLTHGNNAYEIEYLETVIQKDIPLLPKRMRISIKKAIEERLALDPVGFGKPLRYSLRGHRRLRVGDYRIVYRIEKNRVIIVGIRHRKEIYE